MTDVPPNIKCSLQFEFVGKMTLKFSFTASYPEDCKWAPVIHRAYISGYDSKTLYTSDINECKKACEDERDFHCVSFDFYCASERCYLSPVNRYENIKLSTHTDYDYYERDCYGKCTLNYRTQEPLNSYLLNISNAEDLFSCLY